MRPTIPSVRGNHLYQDGGQSDPIEVGTPAWYGWLEQHRAFTFVDDVGTFTARKSMLRNEGSHWIASSSRQGRLSRIHLGYSHALTLARLKGAARAFAGEQFSEKRADPSLTPSTAPNVSMSMPPREALAVDHTMVLLQTKLYRPRTRSDLISRARLLKRLNAGLSGQVTLVSAPVGYGKSTLLAQWAQTLDRPTAWLSLDEHDNDPRVFVQSLAAALQSAFPGMFHGIASLHEARIFPAAMDVVSLFMNDLADAPDDAVLVLDDYHVIHNIDIHTLIELLIERQPHQLHFVLSTRSDPPLPLVRWRDLGYLDELRPTDLRFTQEEAQAFLGRILEQHVTRETVLALEELSEGWIVVLRLAAISLRTTSDAAAFLQRLHRSPDQMISGYLMEEVLNHVAPEVQELLMKVSILEQFSAELCATLLGGDASQEQIQTTLNWLERSYLLLIPLDEQHGWYRFHHLFGPLLQKRLHAHMSTEEIDVLHLRASAWYAEQGLIEEAIEHALAAHDASTAANLVEEHFISAFEEQNLVALERWLHLLPEKQIQSSPGLLFARAWILQIHGQLTDIPRLLKDAEQLLAAARSGAGHRDAPYAGILYALNALFWSFLQFFAGQPKASMESALSALAWLPPNNADLSSLIMQFLAWSCQACGQEAFAHRELRQAMEELSAYPIFTARLLFGQAPVYLAAGKLRQAERAARRLLRVSQEADLIVSQQFAHWLLGVVHYEWNKLDSAEYHFSVVIANQLQAHFWVVQDAMRGLALTYQAKGAGAQAQETSRALLSLVQEQHNIGQTIAAYAFCGHLALLQDEVEQAAQWLEMAGSLEVLGPLMFLEDPPVTRAWMLLAKGDEVSVANGQALLEELTKYIANIHNTRKMIQVLALQAWAYDLQGRLDEALEVLERALTLASPGGFIRTFASLSPLARLIHELRNRRKERREVDRKLDDYLHGLLAAMSPEAASTVSTKTLMQQEGLEALTGRELHILRLLDQDLSNKEIARELVLTTGTVKVHTSNLYRKLGVNNRRAAVTLAKALGLLTTS